MHGDAGDMRDFCAQFKLVFCDAPPDLEADRLDAPEKRREREHNALRRDILFEEEDRPRGVDAGERRLELVTDHLHVLWNRERRA